MHNPQVPDTLPESPRTRPSPTLDAALTAGGMIHHHLALASQQHLEPAAKQRLDQHVATAAAGCTYTGLALWSLNAFTLNHDATRRLAETLAGLGAGVLAESPDSR